MSDFIVAVPTPELLRETSTVRKSATSRIFDQVATAYTEFLVDYGPHDRSVTFPGAQSTAGVLSWSRASDDDVITNGDFWSVAAGSSVAENLAHNMAIRGGSLVHTVPVWGAYAAVFGERYSNRVWFWNTTPALEAIHYGSDVEFTYVSNRPLLVALALSRGRPDVTLSPNFVSEYLHFGYSVSGATPYLGVSTLDVSECLVVSDGTISFRDAPQQDCHLPRDHSEREGALALKEALTRSMDRCVAEIGTDPLQFRLSGGKDSRLLAGLLRGSSVDVQAVTFGVEQDIEVQLSRRIASMAEFDHNVTAPRQADGDSLRAQIGRVIFESGGIPPSEAHLGATAGATPSFPGQPIMLGQWPLTKGGLAKVMRYNDSGIRTALQSQGSPLLSRIEAQQYIDMVDEWADSVAAPSEIEKLYLFARQFRSGRYLHSHITHYSRDSTIVYPISDSEVTAVCDALTMAEKVSQRALFLALQDIWSDVVDLPLHGSVWRFEVAGPADISGSGYGSRKSGTIVGSGSNDIDAATVGSSERVPAIELAGEIVKSARWIYLRSILSEDIAASVEECAAGHVSLPAEMSNREFYKLTWRLLVADVWLSGAWLSHL